MFAFILLVLLRWTWQRFSFYHLRVALCLLLAFSLIGWTGNQSTLGQVVLRPGRAVPSVNSPNHPSPVTTKNFVVFAPDQRLAEKVADEAERFRKELSVEWLGHTLKPWSEKCPIYVSIARDAGGETSFAFIPNDPTNPDRGVPTAWQMKIFGPPDRLLDAVLPHEVTHTIFATHFGRPLPRWADEGACTTVEHEVERAKNHRMLMSFLKAKPSRGIPFNRMFTMKRYPPDILPLYAQGYSLAKFLIFQKGKRYFLNYVEQGLENERRMRGQAAWDHATKEFYGYRDLSELQLTWIKWVKNGSHQSDVVKFSKPSESTLSPSTLADNSSRSTETSAANFAANSTSQAQLTYTSLPARNEKRPSGKLAKINEESWYISQMRPGPDRDARRVSPGTIWR